MHDAAEALGALFAAVCGAPSGEDLLDACFGQQVAEEVTCSACQGRTSAKPLAQQFLHCVPAAALRAAVRPTLAPIAQASLAPAPELVDAQACEALSDMTARFLPVCPMVPCRELHACC
jgi:hypothetical protein